MNTQSNNMLEGIINSALKDMGVGLSLDELIESRDKLNKQINTEKTLRAEISKIKKNSRLANSGLGFLKKQTTTNQTDSMGEYQIVEKKISEVFPEIDSEEIIKCYEWAAHNDRVPQEDYDYIPAWDKIAPMLDGIVNNLNTWFYGPTGCGKDAAINFIAARIGMPVINISFDADISRAELVGRDKLEVDKSGATYSEFMEGLLPFAMRHPCILALDEIDFVREDVAYVMQTVLNEGRLSILEKKGEIIHMHPECRIIATANTNGQQDEMNNYNGSRQQSGAFLDRFNNWIKGDYLTHDQYAEMLCEPSGLDASCFKNHAAFIKAYQECFLNGDVKTPLSNRAVATIAKRMNSVDQFVLALECTFLNRLTSWEKDKAKELCSKYSLGV